MDKELTLQEIQQVSLEVLIQFDRICREKNFCYYLAYGTLIGAIRHGGFIPWDDDIDVWMPRDDFDAFKHFCLENEEQLRPNKLCCRENTQNYTYYIPRFCNQEYQYVSLHEGCKNPEIGVFIDIYPLDNYGDSKENGIKLAKKISRINRMYAVYVDGKSYTGGFRKYIKYCMHYIMRIIYGRNYHLIVDRKIRILLDRYTNQFDGRVGVPAWEPEGDYFQYSKKLFEEREEHMFEGNMFYIPKEYDEILKMIYGNYMELPPEEKRRPDHNYKIYKKQTGR